MIRNLAPNVPGSKPGTFVLMEHIARDGGEGILRRPAAGRRSRSSILGDPGERIIQAGNKKEADDGVGADHRLSGRKEEASSAVIVGARTTDT